MSDDWILEPQGSTREAALQGKAACICSGCLVECSLHKVFKAHW